MNLNVGDFLFLVVGDVINIATIDSKKENGSNISYKYNLSVIDSKGRNCYRDNLDQYELENQGWKLLDKSMLSSQS